ncbi:NAD(P)-dependent oxidoreductase [Clostridia bacterium]|nr:NAD(P)-dependent oxidoreductase [Clostridia bacterium]
MRGILVTGVKGQLGFDVCRELDALGIENRGVDVTDFDLTNERQTRQTVEAMQPSAVIHCAAYTAVDKAESNRELCKAVNVDGTAHIAKACADVGAKLVYISTDYVFDGTGETEWETDSTKKPINYYGLTKSMGEDEVQRLLERWFIVRTSWVFGANGGNFVKTMLRLGGERDQVRVVNDQISSPTYTADLARLLCRMVQTDRFGVYHATNEGFCSWFEFAQAIMRLDGLRCRVEGIPSIEYPTAAARPMNSRLSKKSLTQAGFELLPTWQEALESYVTLETNNIH